MSELPEHPAGLHQRGVEAARVGDHARAAALIEQAIAGDGNEPTYHSNLGTVLHSMGRLDDAIAAHRLAIACGERNAEEPDRRAWHHYNLGSVCASAGRWQDAEAAYRVAMELNAGFVAAIENLGTVLQTQGFVERAEANYRQVLALSPERVSGHRNLGSVCAMNGRYQQAEDCYRRAIALAPEQVEIYLELGAVLQAAGELQAAAEVYARAAEVSPEYAEAHTRRGVVLLALGRLDEAERAHRRATELSPDESAPHNAHGAALAALGRYGEAVIALQRAVARNPENPHAHYNLGVVLHREGALDESVAAYRRAVALAPEHRAAWGNLADCLRRLERFDEAVAAYQQRLQRAPDDPAARHLIGALRGQASSAPPPGYVKQVFDDYAPRFDEHLLQQLEYRVPERILDALKRAHVRSNARAPGGASERPQAQALEGVSAGRNDARPFASALDLGCGTGLMGAHLRDICDVLHGIDISPGMLAIAAAKGEYDRLWETDLVAFLVGDDERQDKRMAREYDLITASDVFIYVGALEHVFAGVCARLSPGGLFVFTVETVDETESADDTVAPADWTLRSTGRYSHARSYISRLADRYHLLEREVCSVILRQEHDHPEHGLLYVLQRPI